VSSSLSRKWNAIIKIGFGFTVLSRDSPISGEFEIRVALFGLPCQQQSRRARGADGRSRRLTAPRRFDPLLCVTKAHPSQRCLSHPDPSAPHAGAGGTRNWAISIKISLNISRDTATSAIWNVT